MLAPLPPEDAAKVGLLRAQLPAVDAGIHLDTGSAGPLPAETVRAMRELEDYGLRYGRGTPDAHDELLARMEEARAVVAALLRADPREVALTHNVSEGLSAAVWAVDWRAGDEVVVVEEMNPGAIALLAATCDRLRLKLEGWRPATGVVTRATVVTPATVVTTVTPEATSTSCGRSRQRWAH